MRCIRLLEVNYRPDDFTIHLLGDDQKRYELTVTPSVATPFLNAVVRGTSRLAQTHPEAQAGVLHQVIGCQPIVDDQQRQGIVLLTDAALEIALTLDEKARSALRACIDQLETGLAPGESVH